MIFIGAYVEETGSLALFQVDKNATFSIHLHCVQRLVEERYCHLLLRGITGDKSILITLSPAYYNYVSFNFILA